MGSRRVTSFCFSILEFSLVVFLQFCERGASIRYVIELNHPALCNGPLLIVLQSAGNVMVLCVTAAELLCYSYGGRTAEGGSLV